MDQYIEFIGKNPMLFILLAAVMGMILWTEARRFTRGFKDLSPLEVVQMINRQEALLLDVREDAELSQGRITGAKHIPLSVLKQRLEELNKFRGKPVIAFCRSGTRSPQAGSILKKNQFENVFNMKGGVVAWESAELPKVS